MQVLVLKTKVKYWPAAMDIPTVSLFCSIMSIKIHANGKLYDNFEARQWIVYESGYVI